MGLTPEDVSATNPDYSEIAALAYQLWNDRGCPVGSPEEDWFQAERTLKTRSETTASETIAVAA
jgi:hypothetical protein